MSVIFRCPVCAGTLHEDGCSLKCAQGHTFDRSAAGYVSLLTGKNGGTTGDSKEMSVSRNRFLSRGYYACLATQLSAALAKRLSGVARPTLVDAACGEGFYTAAMCAALLQSGEARVAGVDLSKHSLKYAAKRCRAAQFAAASIFELPLPDACAHAVTDIFAPVAEAEFLRVLRTGGLMVLVGPDERHLWELKAFLYEHPYPNEPKAYAFPGFSAPELLTVRDRVTLTTNEDIMDLFSMTPYFWKTQRGAVERLRALATLTTELAFTLHIFRKLP